MGCAFAVAIVIVILLLSICESEELQSFQAQTLLRTQVLLNNPAVLTSWNSSTDFCNTPPTESLILICYSNTISQLHIIGNKGAPRLPLNFSLDSFITTLVRLPDLKVLTLVSLGLWGHFPAKISCFSSLEILNMTSNYLSGAIPQELSSVSCLHTIILDDNMLTGKLPDLMGLGLTVLSLRKNLFNGTLPKSFSNLVNLRVLTLSHNHFFGEVPDLSGLKNLQLLDLEVNAFGPQFPKLSNKLVTLVLSKNKFRASIPADVSSFYQLQLLDLSFNKFIGPFPISLLALPSITYLNIADNKVTGKLSEDLSCNADIEFVDLSSNLLTGSLPKILLSKSNSKHKIVLYSGNCLSTASENQHALNFCQNEALAVVGILPHKKQNEKQAFLAILASSIIMGGIAIVGLIFFLFVKRVNSKGAIKTKNTHTRSIIENASTGYTLKLLSDARAANLPAYRTFSLEELKEATNNFDSSAFMREGFLSHMYMGHLKDGTLIAIRSLKMRRRHSAQIFMHHIEIFSKLRHRHLVSAIGHCFEYDLDDSSVSKIFLVFEYVPNITLRNLVSGEQGSQVLTWTQRVTAAIGIAKGIQFLHTGIVPGVYSNNLKITDILLDHNLVAKVSSYNMSLLAEDTTGKERQLDYGHGASSSGSKDHCIESRTNWDEKTDIYDFGVILLEIIVGRTVKSKNEVEIFKNQVCKYQTHTGAENCFKILWIVVNIIDHVTSNSTYLQIQAGVAADGSSRRGMVDPGVQKTCLDQSVKTMMEVCTRCLHKDPVNRPSIEDVLWNLQFAAQVQEAWCGGTRSSSEGSPISPQHLHVTFH